MVNPIIAISLMALVAYLPRVVPMAFFRRKISLPFVKSFFQYVPFAVLGVLTFPDIFTATGSLTTAVAGCAVALYLAFKEKSLMVVSVSAIITVYIVGLVF